MIGGPGSEDMQALMGVVFGRYLPNKVVAGRSPDGEDGDAASLIPLLADRPMRDGRATAYVCEGYACQSPTIEPEELEEQLAGS